jgi:hypothetical protein
MEELNPRRPATNSSLYVGTAVVLVILLGLTIWGFISNKASSSTILQAGDLTISKTEVLADGVDSSQVKIAIISKDDGSPVVGIWVGLHITNEQQATEELASFGWYSPEAGRSFYQTDESGQVVFEVKSKLAGDINYVVYAADPEQKNSGKYQSLERDFTLNFK